MAIKNDDKGLVPDQQVEINPLAAIASAAGTQSGSVTNIATGSFTSTAANDQAVTTGFKPVWIRVANMTDGSVWEHYGVSPDSTSLKQVTAGTTTSDVTSALVPNDRGFTMATAALGTAKVCVWIAIG